MNDASEIETLYFALLRHWNNADASGYAACFVDDGSLVGFDGSVIEGRDAIDEHISGIFAHHQTSTYVAKVRQVRALGEESALLRAVVGMVPPGTSELNPAVNAVHALVALRVPSGQWRIAHFHNTPAAFHGRPEESERLTEELRAVLRAQG